MEKWGNCRHDGRDLRTWSESSQVIQKRQGDCSGYDIKAYKRILLQQAWENWDKFWDKYVVKPYFSFMKANAQTMPSVC